MQIITSIFFVCNQSHLAESNDNRTNYAINKYHSKVISKKKKELRQSCHRRRTLKTY